MIIVRGLNMQTKSNLRYRWKDDDVIVKQIGGRRLEFHKPRDVFHSGEDVIVVNSWGKRIRIDKFANKHY